MRLGTEWQLTVVVSLVFHCGPLHSRQVVCYCAVASASQLVWFVLVAKITFPFKMSSIQRAYLEFWLFIFFHIGSHSVVQVSFQLVAVLLLQSPTYWDYRHEIPCKLFFKWMFGSVNEKGKFIPFSQERVGRNKVWRSVSWCWNRSFLSSELRSSLLWNWMDALSLN